MLVLMGAIDLVSALDTCSSRQGDSRIDAMPRAQGEAAVWHTVQTIIMLSLFIQSANANMVCYRRIPDLYSSIQLSFLFVKAITVI